VVGALQAGRKGIFEWSVLADGERLRVELLRRTAPMGDLRGVTEALAWDHDRLEAIEEAAFAARTAGDYAAARESLGAFVTGLRRHIRFEEELLFPVFEQRLGFPPQAGPTAVMRYEHRQIETLLAQLTNEIGVADSGAEGTRARLHAVLGEHNVKEERILYPHTDQALGADEADALVADIQAF
jgi:hemerythrin-like domain-containing protein